MTVRGSITVPVAGRSRPSASNSVADHLREADPERDADGGGAEADRRRLEHDAGEDLATRGAERAQHRELAGALGDRDREGVEDQERADEQGDPGEDQQRGLDEAGELADVVALGLDVLGAGLDLEVVGQRGLRAIAASWSGETPSSAATEIWSNSPSLPVIRWASGRVSTAIVAPPNESTSPSVAIPTSV